MAVDTLDKNVIRNILAQTPNLAQNQNTIAMLQNLLAAKSILKDPFTYTANVLNIAGAASSTVQVNIQADADFMIQAQVQFTDIAAAIQTDSTRVIPVATVLLTDSGSSRQLMDTDVAISSIFGTGSLPFVLPQPKLLTARSNLTVKVTNLTAATTYNIRLSFVGYKLFAMN